MSGSLLSSLLVAVMLLNFYCAGTSRLRALVQAVSLQGVLLGLLPLFAHSHLETWPVLMACATIALKGVVIPMLVLRTLRRLSIKREVEPLVGFVASLVITAIGTALAIGLARKLPLVADANASHAHLVVAASLATVFTGFFLLVSRLKAVTQVVGYLVLENGVFIFGMLLVEATPMFVELGILLDLVAGIFVMGILIGHISREFPSADAERLSALKEE